MSDGTKIEWTDATVNAINGCNVVSPGCTNCYAMRLAGTRLKHHPSRAGLTIDSKAGPVWNGEVRLNEEQLLQPLRWTKPRRIFWNAHGDMFHPSVPAEWIDRCFAIMALTPQHIHQVLTKRADRMRDYVTTVEDRPEAFGSALANVGRAAGLPRQRGIDTIDAMVWPLPNVWLGVSVEDQKRADERIPDLIFTPAAVRFLSVEPLLGPIDLTSIKAPREPDEPDLDTDWRFDALEVGDYYWWNGTEGQSGDCGDGPYRDGRIDWVIVGGESGPGARPMHPQWVRAIRDQCASATIHGDDAPVPFFFKQWGSWAPVCAMSEELTDSCYHPAPPTRPDASRRSKVDQHVLHEDGSQHHFAAPRAFWQGTGAMTMMNVGKSKAGRLLDGIQHDGMPHA
ncbi:phage Gp37/Gp68 family protein [Sphingobium sp. LSP13-1-1.1]|uniref:phage Gp37/Gp68 family protein n=1 Tax=Sphingobium sp. LSP13-1-1.1 TaxID=3135234 RepID=UPI00341DFEEC